MNHIFPCPSVLNRFYRGARTWRRLDLTALLFRFFGGEGGGEEKGREGEGEGEGGEGEGEGGEGGEGEGGEGEGGGEGGEGEGEGGEVMSTTLSSNMTPGKASLM